MVVDFTRNALPFVTKGMLLQLPDERSRQGGSNQKDDAPHDLR
jgi:hypothetical protein